MSNADYRSKKTLYAGGALIALGGLLLLDQTGYLPERWFSFWAAIFLVVGLLKIIQSHEWTGRVWGALFILVAVGFELNYMGFSEIRLHKIWPLFVIGGGISLLLRAWGRPPDQVESSGQLNLFNLMGGGEYRVRTKDFRGGYVTAFLGGFQLDLTEAGMEGDEAVLDVTTILGGGEIRVPEKWAVVVRGSAVAGGYSVKTREGQVEKTLIIRGLAVLGGVEIRN
jgi:predicted membrane protein